MRAATRLDLGVRAHPGPEPPARCRRGAGRANARGTAGGLLDRRALRACRRPPDPVPGRRRWRRLRAVCDRRRLDDARPRRPVTPRRGPRGQLPDYHGTVHAGVCLAYDEMAPRSWHGGAELQDAAAGYWASTGCSRGCMATTPSTGSAARTCVDWTKPRDRGGTGGLRPDFRRVTTPAEAAVTTSSVGRPVQGANFWRGARSHSMAQQIRSTSRLDAALGICEWCERHPDRACPACAARRRRAVRLVKEAGFPIREPRDRCANPSPASSACSRRMPTDARSPDSLVITWTTRGCASYWSPSSGTTRADLGGARPATRDLAGTSRTVARPTPDRTQDQSGRANLSGPHVEPDQRRHRRSVGTRYGLRALRDRGG